MRIRLSLVPGPVVRQQELASRRRALLLIPLLAIVGAAVFYVLLVNDTRRAREVIRDTESRLAPLRLTAAQVGQLQAEIPDLAHRRQPPAGGAIVPASGYWLRHRDRADAGRVFSPGSGGAPGPERGAAKAGRAHPRGGVGAAARRDYQAVRRGQT